MNQRLVGVLLLILNAATTTAQQPPQEPIDLEKFIEYRFGLPQEELNYEDLYETLLLYYTQPLDLNRAEVTELESLHLLNPDQIQSFLRHRQMHGKLLSLYELQAVPGFNLATIQDLLPFVSLEATALNLDRTRNLNDLAGRANRYAILRYERVLENRRGYLPKSDTLAAPYAGSADKLYFRIRLSRPKDFSLGLTAEKDAGEKFTFSNEHQTYGADFYSFHAMVYNRGKISKAVVGDYQVQWGQGLVSGAGFYLGKGAETVAGIMRASTGIRPYTSVVENGFYRGAALSYQLNNRWQLTALSSRLENDAAQLLDSAADGFESTITSIRSSGLHRTASEIQGKNKVTESNVGAALEYSSADQRSQFGVASLYTHLNRNLQLAPRPYNQYYFKGRKHIINSVYGTQYIGNTSIFSEVAYSSNGGLGAVGGAVTSLSRRLDLSVLYRHYSPKFHTFYGVAFSEGSRLQNESGLYLGLSYAIDRIWKFSSYLDQFWFPTARYGAYAPTRGYETLSRIQFQPKKEVLLYTQYRYRQREKNLPETQIYRVESSGKHQILFNLEYNLSEAWSLRSRWQASWYKFNNSNTSGQVLWQDINYRKNRLAFSTRLALFKTDDYENRQYAFERDVLWAFSVPAYYGRGMRYYALVQYKVFSSLSIWLRYARTTYRDRNTISSGNEQIEGNTISSVKFQIKWDF
jgi:hypothetical protein